MSTLVVDHSSRGEGGKNGRSKVDATASAGSHLRDGQINIPAINLIQVSPAGSDLLLTPQMTQAPADAVDLHPTPYQQLMDAFSHPVRAAGRFVLSKLRTTASPVTAQCPTFRAVCDHINTDNIIKLLHL